MESEGSTTLMSVLGAYTQDWLKFFLSMRRQGGRLPHLDVIKFRPSLEHVDQVEGVKYLIFKLGSLPPYLRGLSVSIWTSS